MVEYLSVAHHHLRHLMNHQKKLIKTTKLILVFYFFSFPFIISFFRVLKLVTLMLCLTVAYECLVSTGQSFSLVLWPYWKHRTEKHVISYSGWFLDGISDISVMEKHSSVAVKGNVGSAERHLVWETANRI